jgi:hypothetical protein
MRTITRALIEAYRSVYLINGVSILSIPSARWLARNAHAFHPYLITGDAHSSALSPSICLLPRHAFCARDGRMRYEATAS